MQGKFKLNSQLLNSIDLLDLLRNIILAANAPRGVISELDSSIASSQLSKAIK